MKRCPKCKTVKDDSAFGKRGPSRPGQLKSHCRECEAASQMVRARLNPEAIRKNFHSWYYRNLENNRRTRREQYSEDPEPHRQRSRNWKADNQPWLEKYDNSPKVVASHRQRHLEKTYGLSLAQFEGLLFAQKGGCACCKNTLKDPCVDHDHQTNKVRGLLCRQCNFMLGHANDRPEVLRAGADYLEQKSGSVHKIDKKEAQ